MYVLIDNNEPIAVPTVTTSESQRMVGKGNSK